MIRILITAWVSLMCTGLFLSFPFLPVPEWVEWLGWRLCVCGILMLLCLLPVGIWFLTGAILSPV